ncbi:M10 family metallopeptidase C-terminal domain-containing protein [Falsiroseomonas sp.]|uniref:M10 family metallopeptidase C-terminal domain-containing protein n=1 Tax=Falsiroseomonas sp. TaxID=2870721 RepID=UPI003F6FC214
MLSGGNDVLRFSSYSDSGDIIRDFVRGQDRIDLSAIDANATLQGDQAFEFQGAGDGLYFIPPGVGIFGGFLATRATVSYSYNLYSDRTTVEIDSTDARSVADMTIYLSGRVALQASDFVL